MLRFFFLVVFVFAQILSYGQEFEVVLSGDRNCASSALQTNYYKADVVVYGSSTPVTWVPFAYFWKVTGGKVVGSSTGSVIQVEWDSIGCENDFMHGDYSMPCTSSIQHIVPMKRKIEVYAWQIDPLTGALSTAITSHKTQTKAMLVCCDLEPTFSYEQADLEVLIEGVPLSSWGAPSSSTTNPMVWKVDWGDGTTNNYYTSQLPPILTSAFSYGHTYSTGGFYDVCIYGLLVQDVNSPHMAGVPIDNEGCIAEYCVGVNVQLGSSSSGRYARPNEPEGVIPATSEEFAETPNKSLVYPSPAKELINLRVKVTEANQNVAVKLFDTQGRKLAELLNQKLDKGVYTIDWNKPAAIAPGTYLLIVTKGKQKEELRVVFE